MKRKARNHANEQGREANKRERQSNIDKRANRNMDGAEAVGQAVLDGMSWLAKTGAQRNGRRKCDDLIKANRQFSRGCPLICEYQINGVQPITGGGVDAVEMWAMFYAHVEAGVTCNEKNHFGVTPNLGEC